MGVREQDIVSKVYALAEPILAGEGFELVEIQYRRERKGWTLRLFIDSLVGPSGAEGDATGSGVTLDDCVHFSRDIGQILEIEEVIPGAYTLEVSSPGLDRPLKKDNDFVRFAGKFVLVRTRGPEGRRKIKGRLIGLDNGILSLEGEDGILTIPYDQTERVQLEPELDWARK